MLVDALMVIGGMLGLGVLSRRSGLLPEQAGEVFNRFVLDICLPALVYLAMSRLHWQPSLLLLALLPMLLALASWLLVRLVARAVGWSRATEGCLVLLCMLGNTAFLGYPMIEGLLGREVLSAAVVYDQLGTFLVLSSLGLVAVSVYAGGERPTPRLLLRRLLRFPAFIALLLALLPLPEPEWLVHFLERVASLLVPLALFSVGLSFRLTPPQGESLPLLFGLGLKMLLWPLLAWLALGLLQVPAQTLAVGVLQSAMPPMVTAGALAMRHGLAPRLAASMVGYGVLLSLLLLPLLAWLLTARA